MTDFSFLMLIISVMTSQNRYPRRFLSRFQQYFTMIFKMGMSHKIKGHNYGYNYDWIWRCDEKRCDEKGGVTKKNVAGKQKTQKRKGTMAVRASAFSSESPSPFFKKPKQRKCILWKIIWNMCSWEWSLLRVLPPGFARF